VEADQAYFPDYLKEINQESVGFLSVLKADRPESGEHTNKWL